MAIFFSAATAAGAFGGLLARAIIEMRGIGGLSGWQWIFIIEGLMTFGVGEFELFYLFILEQPLIFDLAVAAFWLMQDYPSTAKFLSANERETVVARLKHDRSSLADDFDMKYFFDALKDWKIWVHMFITIGVYTPLYSFALFLPTIVADLGYTNTTAQLMSVPPYVVACFFCIGAGYAADKMKTRGLFMIAFMVTA